MQGSGGSQSRLRLSLGQAGDPPPGDLPQVGSGTGPGRPNQGERRSHWVPGVETLTSRGREQLDRLGEGRGSRDSRAVPEPHRGMVRTAQSTASRTTNEIQSRFAEKTLLVRTGCEAGKAGAGADRRGDPEPPGSKPAPGPGKEAQRGPPDDSSAGRRQIGGQTGEDGRGIRAPTVADKTLSLRKGHTGPGSMHRTRRESAGRGRRGLRLA